MQSFAFGRNGKPEIWCRWTDQSSGHFECLSGGFNAVYREGKVYPPDIIAIEPFVLMMIWEGDVPTPHCNHYNDALRYIEEQINADL